jgi:alkanesulfonate monooxygenase SsuD/methylene tetrahydromethanopterin reductase-like flavin-dependent oxidoreductase (luciferase family)
MIVRTVAEAFRAELYRARASAPIHVAGAKGPVPGGHEPVPPVQRRQIVPAVGQSPAHPTLARASLPRLAVLPGHGHRGR